MAYSHQLLTQQKIRLNDINELAYDFTMKAIMEYLDNKDNFDPSRNPDLIYYLKYNLLRRIISNYKKSGDNRILTTDSEMENDLYALVDDFPIHESIDVKDIVMKVQKEIQEDTVMSIIFAAKYEEDMKRGEICMEFSIDTIVYDNTMKRLRRIVQKHLN